MLKTNKTIKFPDYIFWEVTSRCNLACKTCYANDVMACSQDELHGKGLDSAIQQMIDCQVVGVDIGGGEPLLRKDIFSIINKLTAENIQVRLTTNGIIKAPMDQLKDSGLNVLQLSVDGFRDAHESIRGQNTFDRTIANIKDYIKAGFTVTVATVITSQNIREIPKVAEFCYELGVAQHTSQCFVPMGSGAKHPELWPNEESLQWLRLELKQLQEKLGKDFLRSDYSLNFFAAEDYCDGAGCALGERIIGIRPNGDIVACPFFPTVLGNTKTNHLKDIWENSEVLENIREAMDVEKLEGKCVNCPDKLKKICRGGCRAVAYYATGNIHAPDPRCWR